MKFTKLKSKIKGYAYGGDTDSKNSEYQGFTGNNYLEDDLERAKHGGIVAGFNRNTTPLSPQIESPEMLEMPEITPDTAKRLKESFNQYNDLKNNARKFFSDWTAKTAEEARKKYDPNTPEGWEQFNKIMQEDSDKRNQYDQTLIKPITDKAYQDLENAIGEEYNTYKKTRKISPEFKEIQDLFPPSYFKQRFNDFPEDINKEEEPVKRFADGGEVVSPELYMSDKELSAMTPQQRNDRSMRLMLEAQAEKTPADMRFYPGVKAYEGQPEVKGKAPAVEESAISPIDFISPSMVTAPFKGLGKGAMALAESEGVKDFIKSAAQRLADNRGSFSLMTRPEMEKSLAKITGSNPVAKTDILHAIGYDPRTPWQNLSISDLHRLDEASRRVSDIAARESTGTLGKVFTPSSLKDTLHGLYPELKGVQESGFPIIVNRDVVEEMAGPETEGFFRVGRLKSGNRVASYPDGIFLRSPQDLGIAAHEAEHLRDLFRDPDFIPKDISMTHRIPEKDISLLTNPLDKIKYKHHLQYPFGFEFDKAAELLSGNKNIPNIPNAKEIMQAHKDLYGEIYRQLPYESMRKGPALKDLINSLRAEKFPIIKKMIK